MYVFFMRHGEAVTQAESDAARNLTETGRSDIGATIKRSLQEPIFADAIDEIWCSHYVRAQQTAELVASLIDKPVIVKDGLSPTDNPDNLLQELKEADKTIVVVSHQPLLGTLVDRLAGLETGRYRMGTSALAALETDLMAYGCCELKWLHQP
jgi:phosphohistidine phosphatase